MDPRDEYQSERYHDRRPPPSSRKLYPPHPNPSADTPGAERLRETLQQTSPITFCGFDTFQASGSWSMSIHENVLVVGSQGTVVAYSIEDQEAQPVARISGLHGRVLHAKILPCTLSKDNFETQRPLIAVVLQSALSNPQTSRSNPSAKFENASQEYYHHAERYRYLQLKVEIYALSTGAHLTDLYESELFDLSNIQPNDKLPNLQINASGRFVTVASSTSGEVFVFTDCSNEDVASYGGFRCIGKFWTTLQPELGSSSSSYGLQNDRERKATLSKPTLYSLSPRWLAFLPPSTASRHSVKGKASVYPPGTTPIGLHSPMAPPCPLPNGSVETVEDESLMNRMARGVAQEVIKGAKWASAQGIQAWRSYWNGPQHEEHSSSISSQTNIDPRFPPTHAQSDVESASTDRCKMVSIVDLEQLADTNFSNPKNATIIQANFEIPYGCSGVSFSPDGLFLLTISQGGDAQYFWNLLGLGPYMGRGGNFEVNQDKRTIPSSMVPAIRQVCKFSRVTNTSVVDIVWNESLETQIAIVTDKSTIHVFDLPDSTFSWPIQERLRPRSVQSEVQGGSTKSQGSVEDTRLPMNERGLVSGALQGISNRTQPIVTAVRNRRSSSGGTAGIFSELGSINSTAAQGMRSGKVVASTVSRSLGAATGRNEYEMRFRLPVGPESLGQGRVRFMTGCKRGLLAAVADSTVYIYPLAVDKSSDPRRRTFSIPQDFSSGRSFFRGRSTEREHQLGAQETAPLSQAEIETTFPLRPLYVGGTITMATYAEPEPWESELNDDDDDDNDYDGDDNQAQPQAQTQWCFGDEIPNVKVEGARAALGPESFLLHRRTQSADDDGRGIERIVLSDPARRRRSSAKAEHSVTGAALQPGAKLGVQGAANEEEFFEKGVTVLDLVSDQDA